MGDDLELNIIQGDNDNNNVASDGRIEVNPENGDCPDHINSEAHEVSPLLSTSQVGDGRREELSVDVVNIEPETISRDETELQRVKRELNEVVVWKLKVWMLILIILFLITLIVSVSLIVCAAGYNDEDEKYDRSSFVVERFYTGNFTLAKNNFTSHPLTQPDESEQLLEQLQQQLTAVYNSSPALARYFSNVTINNFRDETAQFELQFIIPSENEQLVRNTLSRDMVKGVLLQHFYDQDSDAGDHLYVIPTSLSIEVCTKRRI
ncbi:TPA-induced transmembrane protein [Triplophysa dalaica]|uniref:TPA-induced transmembrane protein n=1 Tax=Triplophysa dalaica TaxID=1582913 RepID=UPI0024E01FD5|nr:TPA-induced transmembrane protein [Triplophysa dalaica]